MLQRYVFLSHAPTPTNTIDHKTTFYTIKSKASRFPYVRAQLMPLHALEFALCPLLGVLLPRDPELFSARDTQKEDDDEVK
jgi:hypothetical protein